MKRPPLVSNTTLLLYLGRLGQAHLLPALFAEVYVPEQVALELDAGRLFRPDTLNPRKLDWAKVVPVSEEEIGALPPNRLGVGEQAVIAFAIVHGYPVAGLDDQEARQFAEKVGLRVVGTIGVLLRAKQAGLISTMQPLLDEVQRQGFHLHPDVYHEALELARETGS